MLVASLPYLLLLLITPPGRVFWGFINNPDDHCVYLAWMRQAEQGRFFFTNLFTGDPQPGRTINLLFWLLGLFGRMTHLPLALVDHLARVGFGALLLVLVYHLAACFTDNLLARRAAFGFTALSAGLGWLFPAPPIFAPVDTWQPEAITFLSLYANALFCASMAAMVGIFLCLLAAQRTGKARYAVSAGLLGFLLGNFHSYDVITIAAVWAGYLIACGLTALRLPVPELRQAMIAGLIALPSVLYQYYLLRSDPVFQARAAVPTLSPGLQYYLLGYGLLVPLALLGAGQLLRAKPRSRPERWLPVIWAVVGLAVAFLPVSYQRKLAEGLHIPIALLAAFGTVALAERWGSRAFRPVAIVCLVLALTVPSNLSFLYQDLHLAITQNLGSTGLHMVFWRRDDLEAMSHLSEWVGPSALVQALPATSCLIPALSGQRVWEGHWGETPDFRAKWGPIWTFFRSDTPSDWRRLFLAQAHITHIFAGEAENALAKDTLAHEPCLRAVHRVGHAVLYEVVP
jgi:hypothetical protein